jgi:hypothetical protein
VLRSVTTPTLLIVEGHDQPVMRQNKEALARARCGSGVRHREAARVRA